MTEVKRARFAAFAVLIGRLVRITILQFVKFVATEPAIGRT